MSTQNVTYVSLIHIDWSGNFELCCAGCCSKSKTKKSVLHEPSLDNEEIPEEKREEQCAQREEEMTHRHADTILRYDPVGGKLVPCSSSLWRSDREKSLDQETWHIFERFFFFCYPKELVKDKETKKEFEDFCAELAGEECASFRVRDYRLINSWVKGRVDLSRRRLSVEEASYFQDFLQEQSGASKAEVESGSSSPSPVRTGWKTMTRRELELFRAFVDKRKSRTLTMSRAMSEENGQHPAFLGQDGEGGAPLALNNSKQFSSPTPPGKKGSSGSSEES